MYQSFLFFRDEYKIVTFVNNEVRLDVNVSPSEDTVWLSLADMCLLFGGINQLYFDILKM